MANVLSKDFSYLLQRKLKKYKHMTSLKNAYFLAKRFVLSFQNSIIYTSI